MKERFLRFWVEFKWKYLTRPKCHDKRMIPDNYWKLYAYICKYCGVRKNSKGEKLPTIDLGKPDKCLWCGNKPYDLNS